MSGSPFLGTLILQLPVAPKPLVLQDAERVKVSHQDNYTSAPNVTFKNFNEIMFTYFAFVSLLDYAPEL